MKLLDALYPDGFEGHAVGLFEKPPSRTTQHGSPAELYAASTKCTGDAFFTCGLQPADVGRDRAKAHAVVGIPGLWLDADLQTDDKSKKHFRKERDLISFLDGLPHRPSILVRTGGGMHAYWRFEEVWLFESEAERAQAEAFSCGWQAFIRAEADRRGGFSFDSTHDLARILRVDGCPNRKPGRNNFIVTMVDDRRRYAENAYNPSDFETWQITPRAAVALPDVALPAEKLADEDLERLFNVLRDLDPRFLDTWNRRRGKEFTDDSPSEYCMSLANMAARAQFTDEEITRFLFTWRVQNGFDPKHPKFYSHTIARARELVKASDISSELEIALATGDHGVRKNGAPCPKDPEQEEDILTEVRAALGGLALEGVVRYGDAADPTYAIKLHPVAKDVSGQVLPAATVIIGGTKEFMRQQSWREALVRSLRMPFDTLKGTEWNKVLKRLTILTKVHETPETSEVGILVGWINDFAQGAVEINGSPEAKHEALLGLLPFIEDGALWFSFKPLLDQINRRGLDRIKPTELQGRLQRFCGESERVSATHEGREARKRYHRVPLDQLEEMD